MDATIEPSNSPAAPPPPNLHPLTVLLALPANLELEIGGDVMTRYDAFDERCGWRLDFGPICRERGS